MSPAASRRTLRPAQVAEKIGISLATTWRYVRKDPTFPRPFKLTANTTVYFEHEIDAWLSAKREAALPPRSPTAPAVPAALPADSKTRDAAAALGCRLVADLKPGELAAWTAAGRPGRVQLGEHQLVPQKMLERAVPAASAVPAAPIEPPKRKPGRPRKVPVLEVTGATT